jgi:hypothetical protein
MYQAKEMSISNRLPPSEAIMTDLTVSADARERVQAAFDAHAALADDANEATTRVVVIDSVLTAIGWATSLISRESPSGTGDYLDYVLRIDGQPWMVVEAKRKGVYFQIDPAPTRGPHRGRSIQSFVTRGGQPLRDATAQAARYCNDTGTALACVTNGLQWLFYRGLSRDGLSWQVGNAFVFLGPDEILARFDEFCWCLARANAGTPWLLERLDGPIPAPTLAPSRPIDRLGRIGSQRAAVDSGVSEAFEYFAARFLREIHLADENLTARERMENCYVQAGAPGQLDRTLSALIAEDERETLPDVEISAEQAGGFGNRLHRYHRDRLSREPVVVIGNTGAGKTTYIHRALSELRARDEGAFVAVIDLTGLGDRTSPDQASTQHRIAEEVLDALGHCASMTLKDKMADSRSSEALDPHSFAAFQAMQHEHLEKEQRSHVAIHGATGDAWTSKLQGFFDQFRARPVEHCFSYVTHLGERYPYKASKHAQLVRRPVLVVLDNVDLESAECQRSAYTFAARLAGTGRAIVVVTMREETFEEARVGKGFLSGISLRHAHHVVAPAFDALLGARLKFAKRRLSLCQPGGSVGVHHIADLNRARDWLADVLAPKSSAQALVAGAAGSNMRAALEVAGEGLVGSAFAISQCDGSVEHLLDCLFARRSVRAAEHLFGAVVNCFQPEVADRPLHALRARLLAYFTWSRETGARRTSTETADWVVGQFSAWGYPAAAVRTALDRLAVGRLLAKSTLTDGQSRYRLTAAGHVHGTLLLRNDRYRLAMSVLTDWYDADAVDRFVARAVNASGDKGLSIGDLVEARALDVFDEYLTRKIAAEDRLLSASFRAEWMTVVASAASVVSGAPGSVESEPKPPPTEYVRQAKKIVRQGGQVALDLGLEASPVDGNIALGRLPTPLPVDVPLYAARILWSLEYARLAALGPQRASDIAEIFSDHGGYLLQNTNVARAFRQLKDNAMTDSWWRCQLRRYVITTVGTARLKEILSQDLTSTA